MLKNTESATRTNLCKDGMKTKTTNSDVKMP